MSGTDSNWGIMDEPRSSRKSILLDPEREAWERQPRESVKQYERFKTYRELGRMRSLTSITKLLTDIGDKLTYTSVKTHSYTFRWNERAQAWDQHQDELDQERVTQARRDMIARHQQIAGALITKAITALRNTRVEDMDPADIIRFLKLATDLEIRALGEPHQTISVTGPAGGPIQTEDLTNLTSEERQTRMRELATEFARRAGLTAIEEIDQE